MKIRHLVGKWNRGWICVVGAVFTLLKCYKSRLDLVSFDLSSSRSRRLPWIERRQDSLFFPVLSSFCAQTASARRGTAHRSRAYFDGQHCNSPLRKRMPYHNSQCTCLPCARGGGYVNSYHRGRREGGREGGSWPSCFERSVPLPSLHHHRRPSVARSTLSASALAKGARAPWSGRLVHGFIHSIALTSSFHFRKWPRARACLRASVRRRRHQWCSLFWFFFLFALGGKSGRSWRKFGGGRARSARCFTFPSRDPRVSEEGQLREMFRRQVSAKT